MPHRLPPMSGSSPVRVLVFSVQTVVALNARRSRYPRPPAVKGAAAEHYQSDVRFRGADETNSGVDLHWTCDPDRTCNLAAGAEISRRV
jgi:hypothetical protein